MEAFVLTIILQEAVILALDPNAEQQVAFLEQTS